MCCPWNTSVIVIKFLKLYLQKFEFSAYLDLLPEVHMCLSFIFTGIKIVISVKMSFVSPLMLNSTVNARFPRVNIWFLISVQEYPKIVLTGNSYLVSAVLKYLSWEAVSTYNEKVEKACNALYIIYIYINTAAWYKMKK